MTVFRPLGPLYPARARKTHLEPSKKCLAASLKVWSQSRGPEGSSSRFSVFRLCNNYESGTIMGPFFDLLSHPTRPLPRKTGLGPSIKCFEASLKVSDQSRGLEGSSSRFSVFHLCIWFWNMQQNTSNSEGPRAQKIKVSRISSIFFYNHHSMH